MSKSRNQRSHTRSSRQHPPTLHDKIVARDTPGRTVEIAHACDDSSIARPDARQGEEALAPRLAAARQAWAAGDHATALAAVHDAATAFPDQADIFLLLGQILRDMGALDASLQALHLATQLAPGHAEALFQLARAQDQAGDVESAIIHYHAAIQARPDFVEALCNLGDICVRIEQFDDAESLLNRAYALCPDSIEIMVTFGNLRRLQHRVAEAADWYRRALAMAPEHVAANANLALVTRGEESEAHLKAALESDPSAAEARYSLALKQLGEGRLTEGWQGYEARYAIAQHAVQRRHAHLQEWDGEPLRTGALVIWGEQGVGDEIMFANAVGDALQRAPSACIECDARLVPLFRRSFPDARVVAYDDCEACQREQAVPTHQIAVGSLMRLFRDEVGKFSAQPRAYLVPAAEKVSRWRAWLGASGPGLKIGLCWRSGYLSAMRTVNYPDIEECSGLFAYPGIQWVNLQYGDCEAELQAAEQRFGVRILRPPLDLKDDLDDLAALLLSLDRVISAGTATAQLAGAVGARVICFGLGRPWVLLGQQQPPWYPAMTYLSRPAMGRDWRELLNLPAVLYRAGDHARALDLVARHYESVSSDLDGYARLATIEEKAGNQDAMAALLEQDRLWGRLGAASKCLLAQYYASRGWVDPACELVAEAYAMDAGLKDAYARIGWKVFMSGQPATADAILGKDYGLGRMTPGWLANYAALKAATGDIEAGRRMIAACYAGDAGIMDGYSRVAWFGMFFSERREDLLGLFDEDARQGRATLESTRLRSLAHQHLGHDQEAMNLMAEVYVGNPSLTDGYTILGWLRIRAGRLQDGLELMSRDAAPGRISLPWQATQAYYLMQNGELARARAVLGKVLRACPAQAEFRIGAQTRPAATLSRAELVRMLAHGED